jgi:hypothetical protein
MHVSVVIHILLRKVQSDATTELTRSATSRLDIGIETLCLSEVKDNNLATRFFSDRALDSRWTTVLVSLELLVSGICFLLHTSQPCRQSTKDMDTVWKGSRMYVQRSVPAKKY